MAKRRFDFEKAMARAEEIASAIEQGDVGLEDSIKQFEEGMALVRQCREVLDAAEQRIQQLDKTGDGGLTVREEPPGA
jgi:exodeoxyribonuclease VII small subunit